jgi:hypothetical protein
MLAHKLAQIGKVSGVCNRWTAPVPASIAELAKQDLVNSIIE